MCAIASTTCFFTFFFFGSAMLIIARFVVRSWSAIRVLFVASSGTLPYYRFYRPPRPFPRASIRAGTLAAQRQAPPMTDSTVRTEVHQTFDIHGDLAAKIAFDLEIRDSGPEISQLPARQDPLPESPERRRPLRRSAFARE